MSKVPSSFAVDVSGVDTGTIEAVLAVVQAVAGRDVRHALPALSSVLVNLALREGFDPDAVKARLAADVDCAVLARAVGKPS